MGWKKKPCACGCGRVGEWSKYATNACRQKAYRKRKTQNIDVKAQTISSWLVDIFGPENCNPIFADLNEIVGKKNTKLASDALEKLVYLVQSEINKNKRKNRRVE